MLVLLLSSPLETLIATGVLVVVGAAAWRDVNLRRLNGCCVRHPACGGFRGALLVCVVYWMTTAVMPILSSTLYLERIGQWAGLQVQ